MAARAEASTDRGEALIHRGLDDRTGAVRHRAEGWTPAEIAGVLRIGNPTATP
ncbi:MAG TPA: hypothetical protein VMW47_10920 [Verrucomicrobiae bacterium]|nr:hypothetical protein [Verrucomicrobiae bacterium]